MIRYGYELYKTHSNQRVSNIHERSYGASDSIVRDGTLVQIMVIK